MYKKLKTPCPNCVSYKLSSWSPAGLALTFLLGSILLLCVPIVGWLLAVPLMLAAAVLVPITIVLYLIPSMRLVTARCRQCQWNGSPALLAHA